MGNTSRRRWRRAPTPKPHIVWDPIPFGADTQGPDGRVRPPPLRQLHEAHVALVHPHVIVIHYTEASYSLDVQHVRQRRPGLRAARAADHVRAFRHRLRRRHPPARLAADHVPPHGGPELDGDRDRARGLQRRAGARRSPADAGQPAARALAALSLRHPGRAT